jgi:hypothetical protein
LDRPRLRLPHVAAIGATVDGILVGSNFVTNWGSVGFFGPLTVRPDLQNRGIAKALLGATIRQLDTWGIRHTGLFTFAHSAKHLALYQKFGFSPRFLTVVMAAPATRTQAAPAWSRYSALAPAKRAEFLQACLAITETLCPGLDLRQEIRTVHAQDLGDTLMLPDATGFAICHYGPRSEAGTGTCFIKFGAVRDGPAAETNYARLLDACEALAVANRLPSLLAGVNTARIEAYRHLIARGFRSSIQGIAMHRDNDACYCRPGVFIIDDWR